MFNLKFIIIQIIKTMFFYFILILKKIKYSYFRTFFYYLRNKKILKFIKKNIKSKIPKNEEDIREKVIIFIPEAIFPPHINSAIDLWKNIKKDYNVIFVKCFNNLPRCTFKNLMSTQFWSANVSSNTEESYCISCYRSFESLSKKYNFNYFDLRQLNQDVKIVDRNYFSDDPIFFLKFKYKNIQLAKMALYDYFICNKKDNINQITQEELHNLKKITYSNIKQINLLEQIHKKFAFKRIFLIDEYSSQTSLRTWCLNNNIKTYFFQYALPLGNSEKPSLEILNIKSWPEKDEKLKKIWKYWKNLYISHNQIASTYGDLSLRISGSGNHIFSLNYDPNLSEDIKKKYNLSPKKKIIGLFTSSEDESSAISVNLKLFKIKINNNDAFNDQTQWINETIKFVENRDDFQLIIVFHPRLYRGIGNYKISPALIKLQNIYSNKKYKNVKFVFPQDNVSTYNIIENIDIATVSWSSLAIEISLMGIPVVTGVEKNFLITPGFEGIYKSITKKSYFKKIIKLKEFRPDYKKLLQAIKWYNLRAFGNSIHLQFQPNKNNIIKLMKNNTPLYMQNFHNLKRKSTRNKLLELKYLKKAIYDFKKMFEKNNYNTRLSNLLNKYYEQIKIESLKINV